MTPVGLQEIFVIFIAGVVPMRKALYILAELSDRDFEWMLTVGRAKQIAAGTVLIREGEPIDALYIVLDGMLGVSVDALDSADIARLGYGEVVGEISFVDARPPSATVRAIEDSLVWALPRSQLVAKLSRDLAFSAHFYKALAIFLSDRLRRTVGRLGYEKDPPALPDIDQNGVLTPPLFDNLELAKARLDWMLNRLKSIP